MVKLKNILNKDCVFEDTTIRDVIKVIEFNPFRLAVVLSNDKKLIGTVTDGDIRRFFLKKNNLETLATNVMNRNPISVKLGTSENIIQNLRKKNLIRGIPVVDLRGVFQYVSYEETKHLKKINNNKKIDASAVIMAGGEGRRMMPLTKRLPKPMVKIDGIPLLQRQIINLKNIGITDIYISVNYLKDVIKDYFKDGKNFGVNISYIDEKQKMGTAGSLRLLPISKHNKPLLVLNGDILTNFDFESLFEFHKKNISDITMAAINYEINVPFGVVENDGVNVLKIREKPSQKFLCNAGIYLLSKNILNDIPLNNFYDMTELIDITIMNGRKVKVFPIYEYWSDIGTIKDLEIANNLYESNKIND